MSYLDPFSDYKKEKDHDFISKLIWEKLQNTLFDQLEKYENRKKYLLHEDDDSEDDFDMIDDPLQRPDQLEAELDDDVHDEMEAEDLPKVGRHLRGRNNPYVEARLKRENERKKKEQKRWEFPQRLSSYNEYSQHDVEYAKFVCQHIFGVDEAFHEVATSLLKNLFLKLKAREFSDSVSTSPEPSLVFVLPDVICNSCLTSKDVDICRDPAINDGNWACSFCQEPLNRDSIEKRLLDVLNRRLVSHHMQDLACKKCKMVKNTLVM